MKIIKLLFGSCDQHIFFYFLFTTNQTSSIKKKMIFFFFHFGGMGDFVSGFNNVSFKKKKFIQYFHFCLKYITERVEEKQCGPSCKSS